jgi:uncharacterized protein (TIGR03435 family)
MVELGRNLSGLVGRLVEDRTGLGGVFDLDLEFLPDAATLPAGFLPAGVQLPAPTNANAPSLFTALEEQLGLKLEAVRAPVEVLVIDRVERPTEN